MTPRVTINARGETTKLMDKSIKPVKIRPNKSMISYQVRHSGHPKILSTTIADAYNKRTSLKSAWVTYHVSCRRKVYVHLIPHQDIQSLSCNLYIRVLISFLGGKNTYSRELTVWILLNTVATHMYRSSVSVPLDSCLTVSACVSSVCKCMLIRCVTSQ